jgi:hypothetical protein
MKYKTVEKPYTISYLRIPQKEPSLSEKYVNRLK